MSIINYLLEQDKELFLYLNALGTESWDTFWTFITNKLSWIPLYLLLLYLLFKNFGWKKALWTLLFVAVIVTFTDQAVNLIKNTIQRLRPNNDPAIQNFIRIVKPSGGYSFLSGHATNSFAVSCFFIALFHKTFKSIYLILLWPFLFMYSRIYVGVHYPLDVFSGMLFGLFIGYSFYKLYVYSTRKFLVKNEK